VSDLRISQWDFVNEEWDALDLTTLGIADVKVKRSNSHPAILTFTMTAANYKLPLSYQTVLAVWDEGADHADGVTAQSADYPLFEGWVEVITPGSESNEVSITAYDPSWRAARLSLMNLPWDNATTPDPASSPLITYNATNDASVEYALARAVAFTVGEIIEQVMDDHVLPLQAIFAAPAAGTPYDSTEIDALASEPQSTVTAQTECFAAFCERLLAAHDPAIRMFLEPGTRKWRFQNMKEAPEVTITLNDPSNPTGMVLAADIQRSADGRYGAVEIYGPPTREWAEATYTPAGPNTLDLTGTATVGTSPEEFNCWYEFQVVDPDFTRMVNRGPYPITVPGPTIVSSKSDGSIPSAVIPSYTTTHWATFIATFQDNDGGSDQPASFSGWICDARSGIVSFGNVTNKTCVCRFNPTGTPKIETPESVTFLYPRLAPPLKVRVPESGFEGTAYTVGGLENTYRVYDETLAVGYENGNPVGSATREARFEEYAAQLLEQKKDLIYAGPITLEGMAYEFALLNRRVNLEALDDDGDPITDEWTWDTIGALVSDVEYDFKEGTTTISFSSDQLEALSMSQDEMKARLKIRPAEKVFWYTWNAVTFRRPTKPGGFRSGAMNGDTVAVATIGSGYVDEFGEAQ